MGKDPGDVVRGLGGRATTRDILARTTRWRLDLVREPEVVHVTVPSRARPVRRPGVRYHWSSLPTPAHGWATPVLRTVLDCAAALPFDEALPVADSALRLGLTTREALLAGALASPRTGQGRRLRVTRFADARAANVLESRLRGIVLGAGFETFEPQFTITLPRRTVRPDLVDPVRRVVIEAEGFEHHGPRAAFTEDCRRYDELTADGWIVLRFTWEQVMDQPAWVADVVREACLPRPSITYHRD